MALPTNTSGGLSAGGSFFKAVKGNNKILILDEAIEAYSYWTTEMKPVMSRTKFEEPLPEDAQQREKRDKEGNVVNGADGKPEMAPAKQQYMWIVPVWNFDNQAIEIFQITQKGIRDELVAIQSSDWGSPIGTYTISLNKTGEGLQTRYKVTPTPITDKNKQEIADIVKAYKADPMDVEAIVFKD